jgi:hypothetical protein
MNIKSKFRGLERQREKREHHKAKLEGREERADFPPLVLIALVAAGSLLSLFGPLVILVVIFPLVTRSMVRWDFRLSIKLAALIAIVFAITISLFPAEGVTLIDILFGFVYQLALVALIMYVGVYLVNMMQGIKK